MLLYLYMFIPVLVENVVHTKQIKGKKPCFRVGCTAVGEYIGNIGGLLRVTLICFWK